MSAEFTLITEETAMLRWLIKEDGSRVLQEGLQLTTMQGYRYVDWRDVREEKDRPPDVRPAQSDITQR